jgi:hypothetical protein
MLRIVISGKLGIQRLWLVLKKYPEIFYEEGRANDSRLIHNNRPLIVAIINNIA